MFGQTSTNFVEHLQKCLFRHVITKQISKTKSGQLTHPYPKAMPNGSVATPNIPH